LAAGRCRRHKLRQARQLESSKRTNHPTRGTIHRDFGLGTRHCSKLPGTDSEGRSAHRSTDKTVSAPSAISFSIYRRSALRRGFVRPAAAWNCSKFQNAACSPLL
jgi:hypothetical protein